MKDIYYKWRYYTLGREHYLESIKKIIQNNFVNLRTANIIVIIFGFCFMYFPLFIEKNIPKAGVYFIVISIAVIISILANVSINQNKNSTQTKKIKIYILTTLHYINVIMFGIYIGVITSPDGTATSFMPLLICALFLFINPPLYNLLLTLGAMIVFIILCIIIKEPNIWIFDIFNVLFAGLISIIFSWLISMYRMVSVFSVGKLEEERNSYYNQSTIDELTGLKNRRDFTQSFNRRLNNYRSSDDWLCIAIMDIDCFKNYNDHYGHPKGDDCLRSIGKLLNSLNSSMNVYSARTGGEEFALIWYEKNVQHLNDTASQIQQKINDLNIPHEKSTVASHITVSIGIHTLRCGSSTDSNTLYSFADKALYEAKKGGRNRFVIYEHNKTQTD
ncbi:MAG: GGDEF domain-containing protein [Treponema sp.]|nr:GGDEF domain-containing protein [Treponema sp.]